jgi:threonyl-tRNA synthetase
MLVVGDKEMHAGTVSVRLRAGQDRGAISIAEFIENTRQVIASKELL